MGLISVLLLATCGGDESDKPDEGSYTESYPDQPGQTYQPQPSTDGFACYSTSDQDFEKARQQTNSAVTSQGTCSGIVARFLKEADNTRTSIKFFDFDLPEWKEDLEGWLVQAAAYADNEQFATIAFIIPALEPGNYSGSDSKLDTVMGMNIGPEWLPKDEKTSWSLNPNGWVDIQLESASGGDLKGCFTAKLFENSGDGYMTIDMGYIFINR